MAVIALDLTTRIRTRLADGWARIGKRSNTPQYLDMTQAIGTGIAQSINVAGFTTLDVGLGGSPAIAGVGLGLGIRPDRETLTKEIYKRIRDKSQAFAQTMNAKTGHPIWDRPYNIPENYEHPYSPPEENALLVMAKGISESVYECFSTQLILNSSHPSVYLGDGIVEHYTNIDSSIISGNIFTNSSLLEGPMWPQICDAIGEAINLTLQNNTEAQVIISGTCISGPNQACGMPISGVNGMGTLG